MTLKIERAKKFKLSARVCIWGTEKQGKTHAALSLATALAERETPEGEDVLVGVISSEFASSQLLQPKFPHDIVNLAETDAKGNLIPNAFSPARYEEAIKLFIQAGYKAIVIDSLSHVWEGEGGILDSVNKKGGNSFSDGWGTFTPIYKRLINTILAAKCHIIVTLRSKEEYKQQEYTKKDGKTTSWAPKNVGQAPIIRQGFGYEMHLKLRMDSMIAHVEATAVQDFIPKDEMIENVGADLADRLLKALDGEPAPEKPVTLKDAYDHLLSLGLVKVRADFYQRASEILGIPVTAENVTSLDQDALKAIMSAEVAQSA